MKSEELRVHFLSTYISLRIGIAVLGIGLPIVLLIGGHIVCDLPLQESMSAYYHSGDGAMRDIFVGFLFAIGFLLYLYKGFTTLENYALNCAGVCLVLVAIFPMEPGGGNTFSKVPLHGVFAFLFFLSIAYVCIFRASDTVDLVPDKTKRKTYKKAYRFIGLGMIASPIIAVLLTIILHPDSNARPTVFVVESFGSFVFGGYWIFKTCEIRLSSAEQSAIEGKLITRQYRGWEVFRQISVDSKEPLPVNSLFPGGRV
jgi:hypothetical protein